jgi:cytochrome P450
MTKSADDVTVDFDHHQPVAERDPDDAYAELRERCPVAWSPRHGGFWVITKHADVLDAFTDHRSFSTRLGTAIPPYPNGTGAPLGLDPPESGKYRRALSALLSQDAVAALTPMFERWTTHFIDEVIEFGTCDLVRDLASPIPGAITMEWVGWSVAEEGPRISKCFHDLVSYPPGHPRLLEAVAESDWFERRVDEEIAERRAHPSDDVLTKIATMKIDGKLIEQGTAAAMAYLVISGGVDTTTSLIGSALVHLHNHHDHRRRLIDDPYLWETATGEFLRRYPPVRTNARVVTADVEFAGCALRKGDRVLIGTGSACHDADVFPNPSEVILERAPNRHPAFGFGVHRCVGMHAAVAQFKTVMREVLERMPDYHVLEEGVTRYVSQPQVSGYGSVPAVFIPGPRSS